MLVLSANEAVRCIESGNSVYIQGGAALPYALIDSLTARAAELTGVNVYTSFSVDARALPYAKKEYLSSFNVFTFFVSPNIRNAINEGVAQTIPVCLSEIPILLRKGIIRLDVVFLCLSEPDEEGYCSYGISSDITCAAVECSKTIVAQINNQVPYSLGDARIHISRIDYIVYHNEPLVELENDTYGEVENAIAKHIANEIPNGATLQIGVGSIPRAITNSLIGHQHLGIHSEVISDGVMDLINRGVIDNTKKRLFPGFTVASVAFGSAGFYRFLNNNSRLLFKDVQWVNNPYNISRNPDFMAINSAIEIDLTGQVCADSIGPSIYSGIGGQHDFVFGASISKGGKSFIVLPSKTSKGESRIVSTLKMGAGVTTPRYLVQYVVTENGIVYLQNKSLPQRAKLLISLAAPEFKEHLEKEAVNRFGISFLR